MNKQKRKTVKRILENIILNEFLAQKTGDYFDCKVVNIKKEDEYIFDVIRYYEHGSERDNDCYWSIEDIERRIKLEGE